MKPRIAFIVQRYGVEVNGGAEFLCRSIAEHMRHSWDIDVLSTCALDYMSWANHYPEGESSVNGVSVIRFPVIRERNIQVFNKISEKVFNLPHTDKDEIDWMMAQGPDAPQLISYITANNQRYDLFIFVTYLYGTTFWCLPLVADKAFLIPTAHDEPPIHLNIFDSFFEKPTGFIFSTPEEKNFLIKRFGIDCRRSDIIGVGIKTDINTNEKPSNQFSLPNSYVIYVGRIDDSKGCGQLFNFWERYKRRYGNGLKLVLVGGSQMKIPDREDILYLGYISETDKYYLISNAKCLIMPSFYESFSIVLLEAWLNERPVLVNGRCDVLIGQCRRGNGGLWYQNYNEFEACLNYILENREMTRQMAMSGKRYTMNNYDMSMIKQKYLNLIGSFIGPPGKETI